MLCLPNKGFNCPKWMTVKRTLAGEAGPLHPLDPCRWRWPHSRWMPRPDWGPCGAPAPRALLTPGRRLPGQRSCVHGHQASQGAQGKETDPDRGPGGEGWGLHQVVLPWGGGLRIPIPDGHCCVKHGGKLHECPGWCPFSQGNAGSRQHPNMVVHVPPARPPDPRHPEMATLGCFAGRPKYKSSSSPATEWSHTFHPHLPLGQARGIWGTSLLGPAPPWP